MNKPTNTKPNWYVWPPVVAGGDILVSRPFSYPAGAAAVVLPPSGSQGRQTSCEHLLGSLPLFPSLLPSRLSSPATSSPESVTAFSFIYIDTRLPPLCLRSTSCALLSSNLLTVNSTNAVMNRQNRKKKTFLKNLHTVRKKTDVFLQFPIFVPFSKQPNKWRHLEIQSDPVSQSRPVEARYCRSLAVNLRPPPSSLQSQGRKKKKIGGRLPEAFRSCEERKKCLVLFSLGATVQHLTITSAAGAA